MKNPRSACLLAAACLLLGLILGLSFGNRTRADMHITTTTRSVSAVPEEITLLVNINTASIAQLSALPGIGEGFAERIVEYRETVGPFDSVEDLLSVEGIGYGRLEAILDYITVGGIG